MMADKLFTKRLRDLTDEAIRESLAEISVEFEKRFGPAAWNTRATQPLSLTVDEGVAQRAEEDYRLIEVAKILCGHFSSHEWVGVASDKAELRALVRQPQSTRDVNEETKDSLRSAAFDVLVWVRDREALLDRLRSLSLPVDIDRSGLAQEVD